MKGKMQVLEQLVKATTQYINTISPTAHDQQVVFDAIVSAREALEIHKGKRAVRNQRRKEFRKINAEARNKISP